MLFGRIFLFLFVAIKEKIWYNDINKLQKIKNKDGNK